MQSDENTLPQVLYNVPDPTSSLAELYIIHGTTLPAATDPVKRWVVKEEHGYWDEKEKTFKNSATTFLPSDPDLCLSVDEIHAEVKKQIRVRVKSGFKYQMEWDPFPPFYRKFEILMDGTKKRMPD